MTPARSALLLATAAAVGGVAMGAAYDARDGFIMAGLLLLTGAPVLALTHWFVHRRPRIGSLRRQLALGTGGAIGLALLATGVVATLMFVSPHDAFTLALLLGFAAVLAGWAVVSVMGGVLRDVETVRRGVRAVGEGAHHVRIETEANDEIADLAAAANRMVAQLADHEEERAAAEDARRALMAAVSHDLRTPLASLRVLAEAIAGDVIDDETRRRYVGQLSVHIDSLGHLIDDMFELSRLEAGEITWSMQQVRLDELVWETVDAMAPRAVAQGLRAEARVMPDLPAVRANPEKVQRVLFNLIDNAIRHTPAEGEITVAAERSGERVLVEVADTGEGIAPEERERVFEPFFRGGSQSARTKRGSGLGLTICRAIVEAHEGEIWLEGAERGTRVRFTLPAVAEATA